MPEGIGAVVPAAGSGRRLGGRQVKALVSLAGQPLIVHTLKAFQATPAIRWIVVAAPPKSEDRLWTLVRRHHLTKVCAIVAGASSRAESVMKATAALPVQARWVIIHDGARPCVTRQLIAQTLSAVRQCGAVACGLPASLTVKAVDAKRMVRLTLDREGLWFVQTPQAFRRDWFADALAHADHRLEEFPDDAALCEWAGFPVRLIPGDPLNIKVTTKEDLLLAEAILRRREMKGGERV